MKRLFVTGLLFVFMAVMPVFHAVADNNQCRNLVNVADVETTIYVNSNYAFLQELKKLTIGKTYTISANYRARLSGGATQIRVITGGSNIAYLLNANQNGERTSRTFVMTRAIADADSLIVYTGNSGDFWNETGYLKNVQIEEGDTATEYTPYNPLCATCDGQIENYVSATGTVSQNGTPSPTNPIEPVFYQQGDMILRKVGNIADSYDATTGKITRRVGMKVLDGTESWGRGSYTGGYRFYLAICDMVKDVLAYNMSSQYQAVLYQTPEANIDYSAFIAGVTGTCYGIFIRNDDYTTVQNFKNYLAQQYAAGTPVAVYYPLATETTENWNETTYCAPNIKIATTAYNAARFSPVQTDLNNAVATIREIVTKTINQTAAIASLQADKQTRPEDACPAGKKCLLVETEENGVIVPHWFPIIEAPED